MMYPGYAGVDERTRATLAGQVFGLLGFSALFTMGGALVAPLIGPGAFLMSLVGSFGALIALMFLRNKSPINLGLFYLFSVAMGLSLGLIVQGYVAAGQGMIVANAAATTAALVLALSAYAWTTKRDLSGLGPILFVGLIGLIVGSLVNAFFFHATGFSLLLSAGIAVVFSGYILYDMQRLRNAKGGTGDAILIAVSIYLDIFNLFLAILQILGFLGGRDE
ncbi:MAG TPA: Bax inhibitor-1 family protein [Chloroflexota bacterium]|jgi:modulator of FtsH protease